MTEEVKVLKYGSRQDVFEGRAQMTSGKLRKDDLVLCEKTGKIKSVRAVERGRSLIQSMKKPAPIVETEEVVKEKSPAKLPDLYKPKRVRKKKTVEAIESTPEVFE